jgi:hypothetical protein
VADADLFGIDLGLKSDPTAMAAAGDFHTVLASRPIV